jgi:hypothetical protein
VFDMKYMLVGATAAMALLGSAVLATAHAQDERSKGPAPDGKGVQRGPTSGESERAKEPPRQRSGQRDDRPAGTPRTDQDRPQPKATQQQRPPDRDQPRTGQQRQQEKDQPKAAQQERQDRDRQKATRQEDRERQKVQREQQDRDRAKAAEQRDRDRPKATEQQRPDKDRPRTTEGKDRPDAKGERVRTQVSEQNRRSAGDRIRKTRVERVQRSRINVSIDIGATLPRSVRLYALPVVIYEVAPAYRGYRYVVLEDDTILIVDARTYVIVDVIPAGTERADVPRRHLTLSTEEMRFVSANVRRERTADVRVRLALGAEVPRGVELLVFPDTVTDRVGELARFRYIVAEDDVVIVDPDDRGVVLVIGD